MKQKRPPWYRGAFYYFRCLAMGKPRLVNLELTKKCNASCSFCTYWQMDSKNEISDYSPIVKMFKPVVLSITGGEPLMRKNYDEILRKVRPYCHYLSLITNGALLNENSARKLAEVGVNQISVSLDYLSDEHDRVRMISGLFDHISKTLPKLTAAGYRLSLNTIIMESNLDQIVPIAHKAKEWGVDVSYSAYCSLKSDDDSQMVKEQRLERLLKVVEELKLLKRKLHNIKNSDYYLSKLHQYFKNGCVPGCKAGERWIQVTPDGYIQQCSELPRLCHYTEFSKEKLKKISCCKCWYTCRGEAEANPLEPRRLFELMMS